MSFIRDEETTDAMMAYVTYGYENETGMPQHKHSRFYYKMIRTNSHTAAIPKRIMEKAAESPNSNTPTASEMINPSMLNTAPITFRTSSAEYQQI